MLEFDSSLEGKISELISGSLGSMGFEIVKINIIGGDDRKVLQILIDRTDGTGLSVGDCTQASRQISAVLDVEDVISDRYNLEVSSAGIDRPLVRIADFERFKGLEAKINVKEKISEQRKFRGRIVGVDGDNVLINANVVNISEAENEKPLVIEFENIKSAKLELNDELLALHKNKNADKN